MILESYTQALLKLIHAGKIKVEDIKDTAYRQEVEGRLNQE
jgi:hypothetical protein